MSEELKALVRRLRGEYRVTITDGLGPAGGAEPDNPNEFVRHFPTAPIQLEAADAIEALIAPHPAASVDREALIAAIHRSGDFAAGECRPKAIADALIAAGMVNRPEAVVHEEALHQTLADLALAEATIAEKDAEIARLREALTKIVAPVCWGDSVTNALNENIKIALAALKETEHD